MGEAARALRAEETGLGWLKTENGDPRDRASAFVGEFGIRDFTTFYQSIIFRAIASSDLLLFGSQSFLEKLTDVVGFALSLSLLNEIGSPDYLCSNDKT